VVPREPRAHRYFRRFSAAIWAMVRQKGGLDPVPWQDALPAQNAESPLSRALGHQEIGRLSREGDVS
jgi:hypothetical protein